jgi:hypothetical protein
MVNFTMEIRRVFAREYGREVFYKVKVFINNLEAQLIRLFGMRVRLLVYADLLF